VRLLFGDLGYWIYLQNSIVIYIIAKEILQIETSVVFSYVALYLVRSEVNKEQKQVYWKHNEVYTSELVMFDFSIETLIRLILVGWKWKK